MPKQSHSPVGAETASQKSLAVTRMTRFLWYLLISAVMLAGCAGQSGVENSAPAAKAQDPLAQAAAEATAIVLQARTTALIIQAQVQATALIEQAQEQPTAVNPAELLPAATIVPTGLPDNVSSAPPAADESIAPTSTASNVVLDQPVIARQGDFELYGVGYAADGGFIMINFRAPPNQVAQIYQGTVSVTDEETGEVYDEIPVIPVIGPMVGRPVEAGQRGYVMLVNRAPSLPPGALVTVILGEVRFEHIQVQ